MNTTTYKKIVGVVGWLINALAVAILANHAALSVVIPPGDAVYFGIALSVAGTYAAYYGKHFASSPSVNDATVSELSDAISATK